MIRRLDKLILGAFFPTFILTFFICLFVLVLQFLFVWMDEIIGKGLETMVIIEFFFFLCSSYIPMALPLAILLASLMTYGNLGEHYELIVIKSSGTSLLKAMRGNFIAIILICFGAFLISNYYLPFSVLKVTTILHDIRDKAPTFSIKENEFYNEIQGFSLRIDEKEKDNKTVNKILIYDHRDGRGNTNVLFANKGIFENDPTANALIFKMEDGNQYEEIFERKKSEDKQKHIHVKFEKWEKIFDLSSFQFERSDESLFKDNYKMLNISQLDYTIDSIHRKFATEDVRLNNGLSANFTFLEGSKDTMTHFDLSLQPKKKKKKGKNKGATGKLQTKKKKTKKQKRMAAYTINDSLYQAAILQKNFLSQFTFKEQSKIIKKGVSTIRNVKNTTSFYKERQNQIYRDIALHEIEWHRKFILSISCLVFFLIGAPLGAVIRKGGFGLPFILTILLYITYHIISISFEKMAKNEVITPLEGMWAPIMTFLPFGVILTINVTMESKQFREFYLSLFKKIQFWKA